VSCKVISSNDMRGLIYAVVNGGSYSGQFRILTQYIRTLLQRSSGPKGIKFFLRFTPILVLGSTYTDVAFYYCNFLSLKNRNNSL
jgi:hypothetical protein